MAVSSFRPMRRLSSSCLPNAVSNRHPWASRTIGIGNGQSSRPTCRMAVAPSALRSIRVRSPAPPAASAASAPAAAAAAPAGIAGAAAARGAAGARVTRGATTLVATERAALLRVGTLTCPGGACRGLLRRARTRSLPASPPGLASRCHSPAALARGRAGSRRALLRRASSGGKLGWPCSTGLAAIEAARHALIRAVAGRDLIAALVLLRGSLVPVAHAAAVLGVVLPPLPAAPDVRSVAAPVDIFFLVDVDVLIPAPAAPAAVVVVVVVDIVVVPVAAARDLRTDRHSSAEREKGRHRVVVGRIRGHWGVVRRGGR